MLLILTEKDCTDPHAAARNAPMESHCLLPTRVTLPIRPLEKAHEWLLAELLGLPPFLFFLFVGDQAVGTAPPVLRFLMKHHQLQWQLRCSSLTLHGCCCCSGCVGKDSSVLTLCRPQKGKGAKCLLFVLQCCSTGVYECPIGTRLSFQPSKTFS